MKRLVVISLFLLLASCNRQPGSMGHTYNIDGITVLDLHGNWYQMGRQYGTLAKHQMEDVLAYLDEKLSPGSERMASALKTADLLYCNYPKHLKRFFKGLSRASGLSLERVKLCNAVEYVESDFQCSALAAWGDFSKGELVVGRNYDAESYAGIDRDILVTVYHPAGKIPAATIGYAGEIYCVNGFNAEGIFVELNNGMPSAGNDIHWDLIPSTTTLFDALFNAAAIDDFDRFFTNTRSSLSLIIGVADKDEARSYEWCYDGVRRGDVMTVDNYMVSTNHYVNDGWPYEIPGDGESWDSITRRCNLDSLARKYQGDIDTERMKEIMCTPVEAGGPSHNLTRYRIVAVPEEMVIYLYVPYIGKWAELNLSDFF